MIFFFFLQGEGSKNGGEKFRGVGEVDKRQGQGPKGHRCPEKVEFLGRIGNPIFKKKKIGLKQIFFFFEIGRHGRKHFFFPDFPLQAHRIFVSDFFSRLHVTGTKKKFLTVAAAGTKQFFSSLWRRKFVRVGGGLSWKKQAVSKLEKIFPCACGGLPSLLFS